MNQNNIKIDKLLLETGSKIYISEIQEYIVQPSIKQICEIMQGETQFFTAISCICKTIIDIDSLKANNSLTEDEINLFSQISSFEYFLSLITQFPYMLVYLLQLLQLFFPDYVSNLKNDDNNMIFLHMEHKDKVKEFNITKDNYDLIIFYIEKIINLRFETTEEDYNPINEQARKIAEKLKENHKKLQELKNKKNNQEYFYANIINLLRGSGNFNMKELLNMTVYQLVQTFQRYNLYEGRQMQIIYHAAGADIKDFIDWTKEIN